MYGTIVVKYCVDVVPLGNATTNTTEHHYDTYVTYELVSPLFICLATSLKQLSESVDGQYMVDFI